MDVRRIVTGHDADGKAVVVSDGPTPNVLKPDNRPGVEIHNLWVLDESTAKPQKAALPRSARKALPIRESRRIR